MSKTYSNGDRIDWIQLADDVEELTDLDIGAFEPIETHQDLVSAIMGAPANALRILGVL